MKTMILSLIIHFMLISINTNAALDSVSPIRKGESVPDIYFKTTTGDFSTETHFGDYKGKWILLDFWGTYCADCILGLPKMLTLQNQFKDKLKIFIVTADNDEKVQNLWRKFAGKSHAVQWIDAGKALPFITGDTILSKMFPHTGLPTHIWIDTNSIFRSISYASTTTAENIQKMLENKPVFLQEQRNLQINTSVPVSWLDPQMGLLEKLQYYSFLFRRIEIGHFTRIQEPLIDSVNNITVGYSCLNNSIIDLYNLAFYRWRNSIGSGVDGISMNRIIIESKNLIKFMPTGEENHLLWSDANKYCYAVKVPVKDDTELERYIRKDIDQYFKIDSRIEKRKIKCLILESDNNIKQCENNLKDSFARIEIEMGKTSLVIQNAPVKTLYSYLNNALAGLNNKLPFFDETQYKGKICMKLTWSQDARDISLPAIKKELLRYGFHLIESFRDIDMLILSDLQ